VLLGGNPTFYSSWVIIAQNYIKIPWIFRRDTTTSAIDVDVGGSLAGRKRGGGRDRELEAGRSVSLALRVASIVFAPGVIAARPPSDRECFRILLVRISLWSFFSGDREIQRAIASEDTRPSRNIVSGTVRGFREGRDRCSLRRCDLQVWSMKYQRISVTDRMSEDRLQSSLYRAVLRDKAILISHDDAAQLIDRIRKSVAYRLLHCSAKCHPSSVQPTLLLQRGLNITKNLCLT